MKIRLKRAFHYQSGPRSVIQLDPGIHDVPEDLAAKILKFGKAEVVVEKKAPEDKVVTAPENKARVAKKSKRSRSTRSKSNA